MKVAHFGIFAPYSCGQFETTRDLIQAEKNVGINAKFIDCGHNDSLIPRVGLREDDLETVPLEWATNADLIIRHSIIPKEIEDSGLPVVTALHGRPENSFLLEYYGKSSVISELQKIKNKKCHAGFVCFWEEYLFQWRSILGEEIYYIPAPLDILRYDSNKKHDFRVNGKPNILVADLWREDTTPFNVIMAGAYYRENFNKEAKIHIYGLDRDKSFEFLRELKKSGALGEVMPHIKGLASIYNSADLLITPHTIATRVVRESMASGLSMIAGSFKYTAYSADPRNIRSYASEIARCWKDIKDNKEEVSKSLKERAKKEFGLNIIGGEAKEVFDSILKKEKNLSTPKITSEMAVSIGKSYCKQICEQEHEQLRIKRRNERAIEYQFVFKYLASSYPSTILDVGSGMSSLPHLMSLGGFEVDSIDNTDISCWPKGMFNRHFLVEHDDITNTKIKKHYDFITCISTLEHIKEHKKAVQNMIFLLNPEGKLLITFPYNENTYIENVYKLKDAGYGQNFPYICQVFSRKEIDSWLDAYDCFIKDQEYWQVFHGEFWTIGRQYYPPIKTSGNKPHQLTCLLLEKR